MDEFLDIICYPYLYLYVKTRVYVHQGKIHYLSWIVDMRKHFIAIEIISLLMEMGSIWKYYDSSHSFI